MPNLVKEHLRKIEVIPSEEDKFITSLFVEGDEWEIYQLKGNSFLYVFFDVIEQGIGSAFCLKITCHSFTYKVEPIQHSVSFTSNLTEKWEECENKLQDRFLADAIERSGVFGVM